jgi:hypothetical protein
VKKLYLLILSIIFISFTQAQILYRISEVVEDTIDLTERNQYGLFPGITDFLSAQFFIEEDTLYRAKVSYGKPDSVKTMWLRLTNQEVARIKFIVENSKMIEERVQPDTVMSNAVLDRFWSTIEARRISDTNDSIPQSKKGSRAPWVIRGATIGAAIGHLTASAVVSRMAGEMRIPPTEELGCAGARCCTEQWFGCGEVVPAPEPVYMINLGVYYIVTGLITGAGTAGGCLLGNVESKKPSLNIPKVKRTKKGTVIRVISWIYSPMIAIGAVTALGYASNAIVESSEDKKSVDPIELAVPLGIVGFGITFELIRFGYRIANAVDRHEAFKKAYRP